MRQLSAQDCSKTPCRCNRAPLRLHPPFRGTQLFSRLARRISPVGALHTCRPETLEVLFGAIAQVAMVSVSSGGSTARSQLQGCLPDPNAASLSCCSSCTVLSHAFGFCMHTPRMPLTAPHAEKMGAFWDVGTTYVESTRKLQSI